MISRGSEHIVALKQNGELVVWGNNDNGQLNVPTINGNDVKSIQCGYTDTIVLLHNGSIIAWGDGCSNTINQIGDNCINLLCVGNYTCMAVTIDDNIIMWGDNAYDQMDIPPMPSGQIVDIDCKYEHIVVLVDTGKMVAWGRNDYGQCNVPTDLPKISNVACGAFHTVVLTCEGGVVAWGCNTQGQCNVPTNLRGVVGINCTTLTTFAIMSSGDVVVWGAENQCSFTVKNVYSLCCFLYHTPIAVNFDGTLTIKNFDFPTDLSAKIQHSHSQSYSLK